MGTDESQRIPTKVLEYSIRKFATCEVELHQMEDLSIPVPKEPENRPKTRFSFYRFMIPKLAGYSGRAVYMDADMQVFSDVSELLERPMNGKYVQCSFQDSFPEAWTGNPHFSHGRQLSVLVLDCNKLDWVIEKIVAGLDRGDYTYKELKEDLCIMAPEKIGDDLPAEWNHLEMHEAGKTKLTHYTVIATQPWKNPKNPLIDIWLKDFEECVALGLIGWSEISDAIEKGFIAPYLGDYFPEGKRCRADPLVRLR